MLQIFNFLFCLDLASFLMYSSFSCDGRVGRRVFSRSLLIKTSEMERQEQDKFDINVRPQEKGHFH